MPLSFGGTQISRPGAFSVVDTSDMTPTQVGALKTLAVVGIVGTGGDLSPADTEGVSGGVYYFNSPKEAEKQVGAGETLNHMKKSWAHGADLIAVSIVPQTYDSTASELSAPTDSEWQTAIDALEQENVAGLIPATTEEAIQTKFDTHITTMSGVSERKERRGFYGHPAGTTKADVLAKQTALGNERAMIASPAVYDYDANGDKVLKPSSYLASAYAGLWAIKPVQEPITYDYVKFPGLETKYKSSDIGELLDGGIAVTEHVDGKGLRIVRGITASSEEDLTKQELSVSSLKDAMSSSLRNSLEEKYVGKAGVAGIDVSILNTVGSILDTFVRKGWLKSYDPSLITVRQNGTAFEVDWSGKPTLPINNFFITSHFKL